ncbi:AP-3 complex subunit delta, partial [Oleoguttula sp. CCFEE 5521]
MSSAKYLHKRVGYLAAVQSFRPDTEVLMLAENLLKKDLTSPDKNLISLPLGAIPHVINPSMANSLLSDLLSRVSHSSPAIRKKSIVTLYRLAVVYPETLRPAWPKIKERLLDESEDPSVTAAIVNVVCELGWRRPQDFLPLAPRLFELLTQGGNNWMAIKIIKLFSQLTPLEPRLVKKLLPPLTSLIKTTPAMSLLYECINGIIQGGIMEAAGGTTEGDEIARLCVSKLRAMLVVQGDPNLRYVALLAFAKITASHADLVADHQDVILECIDDADISIRTRALDLVIGMINSNNLQAVVQRLLKQLKTAGKQPPPTEADIERVAQDGIIPMADDDDEGTAMSVPKSERRSDQPPPLPENYRILVIERVLELCSKDSYANMDDFDWYINILVDLVGQCPPGTASGSFGTARVGKTSVSDAIGAELLNVAVRVKGVRPEAAAAAQNFLLVEQRESTGSAGVLGPAAFIAGEYANMLPDPEAVLTSMLHTANARLPAEALSLLLHAIPKVFTVLTSDQQGPWTE